MKAAHRQVQTPKHDEDTSPVLDVILSAAAVPPVPVALPTSGPAAAATPSCVRFEHLKSGSLASSSNFSDAAIARSEQSKSWGLGSPGTDADPTMHYISLPALLSLP
eukprot:348252-Karenia_brevis.AAC.1